MAFRPEQIAVAGEVSDDEMRVIIRQEANLAEGICPNGCAPLTELSISEFECPVCKFFLIKHTLHVQRDE